MKKMLTSVWFAAAIGLMGFGVTIGLLWTTNETETGTAPDSAAVADTNAPPPAVSGEAAPAHAGEHDTPGQTNQHAIEGIESQPIVQEDPTKLLTLTDMQVAEPGALSFNNPEVAQLIEDLKREREALRKKEEQLNELQQRIALEKQWIGTITQKFLEAKRLMERAMTNQTTVLQEQETKKLQQLAKIYTNMPPANAVTILSKMSVDDIARILEFMKDQNKAAILETFATNSTIEKGSQLATEISERLRRLSPEPNLPATPKIEPPPEVKQ